MTDEKQQGVINQASQISEMQRAFAPRPTSLQSDNINEIASWLVASRAPGIYDVNAPFALVPAGRDQGMKVVNYEDQMPFPSRVRKDITFADSESFLNYFQEFKIGYKPQLFAVVSGNGLIIMCVFDYDGAGQIIPQPTKEGEPEKPNRITAAQAQWNSHRITLKLDFGRDYKELLANNNKWLSQEDFALFVEENTHLFHKPDAATMLEIAQHLKGTRSVSWQSGKRLSNGEVAIEYLETISGKSSRGEISVPEKLELFAPIFEGYDGRFLKLAFRYKINSENRVEFSYRLLTKLEERAGYDEVKAAIATRTELAILNVADFNGIVAKTSTSR